MQIRLTRGLVATIDEQDAHLAKSKWNVLPSKGSGFYAKRAPTKEERARGLNNVLLHRVILDAPAGVDVDHINGDGLDNRRANLRLATESENLRNQGKHKNNKSGYKGVHLYKGKWVAQIQHHGRHHHLGVYDDPVEAARAYDKAANELHGTFAKPNFPDKA